MTDNAVTLIDKLLTMNPDNRWSAEQSLDADYFFENPIVKPANKLPMNFAVATVHEWECRRKHEQVMAARAAAAAAANGQANGNAVRPPPKA
jgi:hypothetical protein